METSTSILEWMIAFVIALGLVGIFFWFVRYRLADGLLPQLLWIVPLSFFLGGPGSCTPDLTAPPQELKQGR